MTNIDDNDAAPNVHENEANIDDNGVTPNIHQNEGAAPTIQENIVVVQSPSKATRESIMQDSPISVTRSRLAMLMGEGGSEQATMPNSPPKRSPPKKLVPRKLKIK